MRDNERERQGTYIPPEARGLSEEEDQIRQTVSRRLDTSKSERAKWQHFTPEFLDTKLHEINIDQLRKQINHGADNYVGGKVEQFKGRVEVKTELPIAISHIGDTHLGSIYTNTDEVFRKLKRIKETPNAFVIFMSNLIDNAIPAQYPDSMLANAIPPDQQVELIRNTIEDMDMSGKVLGAVTSPCHEGWTWKKAGQDINNLIFGFKGRKFPVLENGGELEIKVGDQDYSGALYHQTGPFESRFNETHALKQLNRLQKGMRMDWMAGAHRHFAAAETVYEDQGEHRKPVAYIRTGTEKGTGDIHDKWAVDRYGNGAEPTGQTVHLFPKQRRVMATLDFDDAMMAHESFYVSEMAKQDIEKKPKRRTRGKS